MLGGPSDSDPSELLPSYEFTLKLSSLAAKEPEVRSERFDLVGDVSREP